MVPPSDITRGWANAGSAGTCDVIFADVRNSAASSRVGVLPVDVYGATVHAYEEFEPR